MAFESGKGFAPFLLQNIANISQGATPMFKLDPMGGLNLLLSQNRPDVLRLNTQDGHRKSVKVRYKQRWTKAFTDTSKSCDNTNVGVRKEVDVELSSVRQFAIHIEDETIAKYEADASRIINTGQPPTGIMNEMVQEVIAAGNAILQGVEDDLMTVMVANIGVNRRTGNNAAATININKDSQINPLTDGLTQIMADYSNNGGMGRPQVLGSGLFHNFILQQAAKSANQSGIDTRVQTAQLDFYHSLQAASIFGANQIVAYEPNAVQLVDYLEYTGFKAGVKPGASVFGVLTLPMQNGSDVVPVDFDFQLKYNDCPQVFVDAYYGTEMTLEKGFNLILSKQSGVFTIPPDAYRAGDDLAGNRGSLRYAITNDCEACD